MCIMCNNEERGLYISEFKHVCKDRIISNGIHILNNISTNKTYVKH